MNFLYDIDSSLIIVGSAIVLTLVATSAVIGIALLLVGYL